jgi:predicted membrane protein
MRKGLAVITAFLLVMAWQYRKNRPVLFVVVGSLFAVAAMFVAGLTGPAEWIIRSLAVAWLICMLAAGTFAAEKLIYILRKKKIRKS